MSTSIPLSSYASRILRQWTLPLHHPFSGFPNRDSRIHTYNSLACYQDLVFVLIHNFHMAISRRTVVIAGLPVHVYSEGGLEAISGPVSVLFLLHGRMGSAHQIDSVAEEAMKVVSENRQSKEAAIALIVVTFVSLSYIFLTSQYHELTV